MRVSALCYDFAGACVAVCLRACAPARLRARMPARLREWHALVRGMSYSVAVDFKRKLDAAHHTQGDPTARKWELQAGNLDDAQSWLAALRDAYTSAEQEAAGRRPGHR